LPLAVGVRREVDRVHALRRGAQLADDLLFARYDGVVRSEAVVDVDAELALRQVLDVPDRRLDRIVLTEVLADGLRLRRRFHDDQGLGRPRRLCHRNSGLPRMADCVEPRAPSQPAPPSASSGANYTSPSSNAKGNYFPRTAKANRRVERPRP